VPDRSQISEARHVRPNDLYIGRGERDSRYREASKWGSPFRVAQFGRKVALAKYKAHIMQSPLREQLSELAGKTLMCTCSLNQRCHGDVLIELFERTWAGKPTVYIGSGSRAHKRTTVWASPFVPGEKFTYEESAVRYRAWLHQSEQAWLRKRLPELAGHRLICECPPGEPCHGDVLGAEVEKLGRASSP
jgi:hypothetical protein